MFFEGAFSMMLPEDWTDMSALEMAAGYRTCSGERTIRMLFSISRKSAVSFPMLSVRECQLPGQGEGSWPLIFSRKGCQLPSSILPSMGKRKRIWNCSPARLPVTKENHPAVTFAAAIHLALCQILPGYNFSMIFWIPAMELSTCPSSRNEGGYSMSETVKTGGSGRNPAIDKIQQLNRMDPSPSCIYL